MMSTITQQKLIRLIISKNSRETNYIIKQLNQITSKLAISCLFVGLKVLQLFLYPTKTKWGGGSRIQPEHPSIFLVSATPKGMKRY